MLILMNQDIAETGEVAPGDRRVLCGQRRTRGDRQPVTGEWRRGLSQQFAPSDLHIALMAPEQLLPDLEGWQETQQARGYPAFRESRNTVIVTGPSKTADIGHQLVKGAHGPREVHMLILA